MSDDERSKSFGVTKPVGHVLADFPDEAHARAAMAELSQAGIGGGDVTFHSAEQMGDRTADDIADANPLASLGQDLNLVKAHRELALQGHCFLSVRAPSREDGEKVAEIAERHGATRAQKFGWLITEELIEPGTGEKQTSESPAKGLDAQTRTGIEGDGA